MIELRKEELLEVKGGASWFSGSFISAITKAGNTLLDMGRSLGTAVRRIFSGSVCNVR